MRRYALRDDQWERIELLLPGKASDVGVTARDNRLFVEAVLYRYRAGIPWRDLPERFGDFRIVHTRHMRWSRKGVWERVFRALASDADNEYAMIDSTIVRAHQHSAGAKGSSKNRMHRAVKGRSEHQDPRHLRCIGQSDGLSSDARAGLRPGRRGCSDRRYCRRHPSG
jgi:transposase